jgi:hypothetical protein
MMAGTSGLADQQRTATRFGSSFDDDYCWDTGDTSSARNHQTPCTAATLSERNQALKKQKRQDS